MIQEKETLNFFRPRRIHLQCKHCLKFYNNRLSLGRHIGFHLRQNMKYEHVPYSLDKLALQSEKAYYGCANCPKHYFYEEVLAKHKEMCQLMINKENEEVGSLQSSSRTFISPAPTGFNLDNQLLNQCCPQCPKRFVHFLSLQNHMKVHARGEEKGIGSQAKITKDYDCKKCGKSFLFAAALSSHNSKVHPESPPFTRNVNHIECNNAQSNSSPIRLKCEKCDRRFQFEVALVIHRLRDHDQRSSINFTMPEGVPLFDNGNSESFAARNFDDLHGNERLVKEPVTGVNGEDVMKCKTHMEHCSNTRTRSRLPNNKTRVLEREYDADDKLEMDGYNQKSRESFMEQLIFEEHISDDSKEFDFKSHSLDVSDDDCKVRTASSKNEASTSEIGCVLAENDARKVKSKRLQTSVQPQNQIFKCKVCKISMKTYSKFKRHLAIHEPERRFPCTRCPRVFLRAENLEVHTKVHTGQGLYKCAKCRKTFPRRLNYVNHLALHENKRFTCDLCHNTYVWKDSIRRHMLVTHFQTLNCDICSREFKDQRNLSDHHRSAHSKNPKVKSKGFSCKMCPKSYSRERDLLLHVPVHSEKKQYSCEKCRKRFFRQSSLSRHSRKHLLAFKCKFCGRTYDRKLLFEKHKMNCNK